MLLFACDDFRCGLAVTPCFLWLAPYTNEILDVDTSKCYNQSLWNPRKTAKTFPKMKAKRRNSSEGEEEEIRIGKFVLLVL